MENPANQPTEQPHKVYPDPTKPTGDQSIHRHISKGWILFIGFNILFPIVFAITYLSLAKNSHVSSQVGTVSPIPTMAKETTSASISPSVAGAGEHCGGNISTAKQCESGYHCQLNKIADVGGTCVKD